MNVLIFTNTSLDGAASTLFMKWLYSKKIKEFIVVEATETTIVNDIKSRELTVDHYDRVFVLGLCLSESQIKEVDKYKLVVFDHHLSHASVLNNYHDSTAVVKKDTSCISLIHNKFKSAINLTEAQERLIMYVNDYESFNLKHSDSFKLSAIFFTYNRPKVVKFIESFEQGWREYNIQEKNAIKIYIKKFKEQLENKPNFGTIKNYKTVAIFANALVSNIAHYIISKYSSEIGIVVNLDTNSVSFRRCTHCDVDVSILSKTFCNGSGSICAAGGDLTPQFAELLKDFSP